MTLPARTEPHDNHSLRERLAALSPVQRAQLRRRMREIAPASQLQFGIWLHEQLNLGSELYINAAALRVRGPLDATVLARAFDELAARHAPLRAGYREGDDGELEAVVEPPHAVRADFETLDARGADAVELLERSLFAPFDLAVAPTWRARVVRVADDECLLGLAFHHLCSDGSSLAIVFHELTTVYGAFAAGRPHGLPTPTRSYFSLLAERERDVDLESLAYWTERLTDAPSEVRIRQLEDADDRECGGVPVALGQELSAQLSRVCAQHGATGFAGLLATFAVLLALESGQRDIVLTTPVDTRGHDGADLVGCFVNTVVLRITVEPDDTLEQVLAAAATSLTGALDHSGVPFARVLAATGPRRRNEPMPFGAVGIVHNNAPLGPLAWAGLDVTHHPLRPRHVKHAFALSVGRTPDGWVGQLEHSGRYSAERAKSVVARWTGIVRVFVDSPGTRVAECAGVGR